MAPPCERHRLTWKWNCRAAAQYIGVLSRAFLKAPRLASHFLAVERPSRDTRASVEEDLRVLTIMASLIGHAMWLRQEQAHHLHTLNNRKGLRELERELVMRALKKTGGVQARAAARLGITPRQPAYKCKKYRIIKEFKIEG